MFAYSVYVPSHQKYKTHFSTNDLRNLLASLLFIFQFLYRILGKGAQKKYRHAETAKITHTQMTDVNVFG